MSSSRSTVRSRRRPGRRAGVDVYLMPAVVGGGLGDMEEVLSAGRRLARAGFPVFVYRKDGRPWPRDVRGPWDWPKHRRVDRLLPAHRAALTVAPAWGVSAAPAAPGPLGRPGPWADEAREIEEEYGPDRTVHASLEEFARTLTILEEDRERLREGGVPTRRLRTRLASASARADRAELERAFRRFRAFERPNVLHLFGGFRPAPGFAREFAEAVQTGPLWPHRFRRLRSPPGRSGRWVWYASPSSAEAIAPEVFAALRAARRPARITVLSPRPWRTPLPRGTAEFLSAPLPPPRWRAMFASADVRIVTGSRTLLEALEVGGPFLYFNGVLGSGRNRRRHRPEKIDALLDAARGSGWPEGLLRDLADFARGRRVREVVLRAADRTGPWGRFPSPPTLLGYPRSRRDLGDLLVRVARALARPSSSAREVVARVRRVGRPRP